MSKISHLTKKTRMKQEVEDKIIEAARELFYEKGYRGTTVRDIANKAEVNLALLHYYFRTKDAIFKIVFDQAFTLLFGKLNKALTSNKTLFEKIEMMVESYVMVGMEYPQLPSFVMTELAINTDLMLSFINNHRSKPALNESFKRFYGEIEEAIANKVVKRIQPDSICTDIQALSLYPFIAKNCLLHLVFADKKAYNRMIKERIEHVTNVIINNIKV